MPPRALAIVILGCLLGGCNAPAYPPMGAADGPTVQVTDANFDTVVLASEKPVLLDCWAPWCGPCRMQEPILNDLAKQYEGRVVVAKLNVDENPKTTRGLGVQGIPALFLIDNGRTVEKFVGVQPKNTLTAAIEAVVGQKSPSADEPAAELESGQRDPETVAP